MSVGNREGRTGRWSSLQKLVLITAVVVSVVVSGTSVYYIVPRQGPAGSPVSLGAILFQTHESNVSGNWTTRFLDSGTAGDFQVLMVWIDVPNLSCANGLPYRVICSYWLNNTTSGWPTGIGGWEDAPGVSSVGAQTQTGNLTLQVRVDYCYYYATSIQCGPLEFNITARMFAPGATAALG